jgi:hypothetical protein
MGTNQYGSLAVSFLLGFVFCLSTDPHAVRAEDVPPSTTGLPEGSSSVIESRTWRVAGSDPPALRQQAKTVVSQIAEAVVVKENETLLVFSLPTQKLPALRQELSKLGSINVSEEDPGGAPTTLLRLMFVRP